MKNYTKVILVGFLTCTSILNSQNIVYEGCNGAGDLLQTSAPNNYTFVNVGTDATGRNIFQTNPFTGDQSCPLGVCELQISWNATNNRWELVADDLADGTAFNGTNLLLYNSSASSPNPPDTTLGTWVDANSGNAGGSCGSSPVTSLSGDVQSTLSAGDTTAPAITSVTVPANNNYVTNDDLNFTVNFDEDVIVDETNGTPQLSITIGATTRQAAYVSGSASSALLFTYTVQSGEFDFDGITIGALATNSGTLKDAAGNDANTTLNSVGSTTGVLVDAAAPSGYSVSIDQTVINVSNESTVSFTFSDAEVGATYNYSFSVVSSMSPVTGSGTISTAGDVISNIDLSGLGDGSISLTVTLTDTAGNTGAVAPATVFKFTGDNDDLGNAFEILYDNPTGSRPYHFTGTTVETGEVFTTYNGSPISSNTTGSLWFKFVATTEKVFIRTDSDDVMNLAIQLVEANNNGPDYTDLFNYQGRYGNNLNGTFYEPWISEESLTIGETYFIQVHNIDGANTNFDLILEPARSYIYAAGSWITALGNPDGINDPYASVAITSGSPVFMSANTVVGDLGTATNATLTTADNSTLTVNGRLFTGSIGTSIDMGANSTFTFIDHGNDFLFSNGVTTGVSNLKNVDVVNRTENSIGSSLNISGTFRAINDLNITGSTAVTFKHTSDHLGVMAIDSQYAGELIGDVTVEQFMPERLGTTKRAFRFVGTPLNSSATIFEQWQEDGNSPAGYGTHITGLLGSPGSIDAATGLDYTASGNHSMFKYDASAEAWNAVTSTNQITDLLNVGEGYRIFIRGDRNVSLSSNDASANTTIRSNGTLSNADRSISYDVEGGDFVLIANPYQNALKLEDLIDDSSNITDDIAYYWDPNLGGATGLGAYVTYTGFNGGGTGSGIPASNNNGYLQPGQAVFVAASTGADGPFNNVVVNYSKSQLDATAVLSGASNRVTGISSGNGDRITMNLYDSYSYDNGYSVTDALSIRFSTLYDNAIGSRDFVKLYNAHESIAISQESNDYSIASRAMPLADEIIALTHYNFGDTDYTYLIELEGLLGYEVFMHDAYLNTLTPLVNGTNMITFSVDANIAASIDVHRFRLQFANTTLGINDPASASTFSMYPNPITNDALNIIYGSMAGTSASLDIVDMAGKKVQSITAQFDHLGRSSIDVDGLSQGIYIVNLETVNGTLSRKLIIE